MAAVIDIKNTRVIGTVEQYQALLDGLGAADVVIESCDLVLLNQPIADELVQQALSPVGGIKT